MSIKRIMEVGIIEKELMEIIIGIQKIIMMKTVGDTILKKEMIIKEMMMAGEVIIMKTKIISNQKIKII